MYTYPFRRTLYSSDQPMLPQQECCRLTLHPSHSFLTELLTFIPRTCVCSGVARRHDDNANGRVDDKGIIGLCIVLNRVFDVWFAVQIELGVEVEEKAVLAEVVRGMCTAGR